MSSLYNYKVSVRLMVYNHEKYIEQSLLGILAQKTNFKVEVVIGDDFSTDNSINLINRFIEQHSNEKFEFNLLKRKKGDQYWQKRQKLGRLYNFVNIIENCSGEYVALLDGDDYWVDPYKLQSQVDILDNDNSLGLCFTAAEVRNEDGSILLRHNKAFDDNKAITIESIIEKSNPIPTCTALIKNSCIPNPFPEFYTDLMIGDYPLHLFATSNSKGFYLNNATAVYRINSNSVYSGEIRIKKLLGKLKANIILNSHFNSELKNSFNYNVSKLYYDFKIALFKADSSKESQWLIDEFNAEWNQSGFQLVHPSKVLKSKKRILLKLLPAMQTLFGFKLTKLAFGIIGR